MPQFSDADQVKLLMTVVGLLWTAVVGMAWRSYESMTKKLDKLVGSNHDLEKDVVQVKADIKVLHEWRRDHSEEHEFIVAELARRK